MDPRLSAVLLAVVALLLVSFALAVGVVAFAVAGMHPAVGPSVVQKAADGDSAVTSTTDVVTSTRPSTTRRAVHTAASTTLADSSPTTFLEYLSTTTTLVEVVVGGDDCVVNHSYHGFRTCGAKNVAWSDSWSK